MGNDFRVGDKIKFLDQKGVGKIVKFIENNQAIIQTVDGFNEVHFINDIIKINLETDNEWAYKNIPKIEVKFNNNLSTKKNKKKGPQWEVDLHIETILSKFNHLTNYEIVQLQLKKCKNAIERAIQRKVYKLVIIHGKGSGVLREEVHQLLKNYPVEIRDSRYQDYGGGATEVFFRK